MTEEVEGGSSGESINSSIQNYDMVDHESSKQSPNFVDVWKLKSKNQNIEDIEKEIEQMEKSDAGVQHSSSGPKQNHSNPSINDKNKAKNGNHKNSPKYSKNNKNYKNINRKNQQNKLDKKASPNKTIPQDQQQQKFQKNLTSDGEESFLSTSPDSANGETIISKSPKTKTKSSNKKLQSDGDLGGNLGTTKDTNESCTLLPASTLFDCSKPEGCLTLHKILDCFKNPISEEQAWGLIYQLVSLYMKRTRSLRYYIYTDLEIPESFDNINVHRDGSVHFSWSEEALQAKKHNENEEKDQELHSEEESVYYKMACSLASHKKVIRQVGVIIYNALDYNLHEDEQCHISEELEDLFNYMTAEENEDYIDEGIDEGYNEKFNETKEFDYVIDACKNHIKPIVPDDHYKAVCRALVTEALELRVFLEQVLVTGANNLHLKEAEYQTSQKELAKLGFAEWARFWVQVIEEMRRGVRLKSVTYARAPIEYELTPYEILMEDIRSRKYQLRKVMVNGDIPPRVKKDAHAIIMDFIRSRPPLKKASERQLAPPVQHEPSPREQLMMAIRSGRTLRHVRSPSPEPPKNRLLLPTTNAGTMLSSSTTALHTISEAPVIPSAMTTSSQSLYESLKIQQQRENITPRSKQRLIKCDLSLLQDDDTLFEEALASSSKTQKTSIGVCSQPKMPPYPIGGYLVSEPPAQTTTISKAQQQQQQQQQSRQNSNAEVGAAGAPQTNVPSGFTSRILRRTNYDLATQCESRRASLRRHTIVGCQSNFDEAHSTPSSRPESRQSDVNSIAGTNGISTTKQLHNSYNQHQQQQQQQQQMHLKRSQSPNKKLSAGGIADNSSYSDNESGSNCCHSSSSVGPWNKSFMDEKTWNERGDDRLSLTLEEIVHIRSVMTKAELEALPVGVRVKEDVEKRKVCFLCLRTRFSIFGPWGIQCKLCQRTVCSKCYTKMRIPSEHFRNVPLVLISPSLLASPASSSTPSPSRHIHSSSTGNIIDDNFPKTLIERLLSKESEQKARNSVGSAPSSPKHQRSNMSTPGLSSLAVHHSAVTGQAVEAIHHHQNHHDMMTQSYTAGTTTTNITNSSISSHSSILANGCYAKAQAQNKNFSLMSRSMEGPRSLPANSPARPHSNSSTLDRKSKFSRAFTLSSSGTQLSQEQKENLRGEQVPVCNDCKGLVNEITRSGKQKRSSARNRTLQNLTLDLSPVWK